MQIVPNSFGSSFREANDCHLPAGSSKGGQFCTKYHGTSSEEVGALLTGGFRAADYPFLADTPQGADAWAEMRVGNREWRKLPPGTKVVVAVQVDRAKLEPGNIEGTYAYSEPIPASRVKVVGPSLLQDDAGQPMTFYHGSVNAELEGGVFDPTRPPVRPRTGPAGISFTTDAASAFNYTRQPRRAGPRTRGRLYVAHLSMQNPLDITKAVAAGRRRGLSFGDAKREALKALTPKHDGVIFRGDAYNPDEYLVRSGAQVHLTKAPARTREANDCHTPAGSPEGGQFCSKGGGRLIDVSGRGAADLFTRTPKRQSFLFLYNSGSDTFIVGSDYDADRRPTHAEDLAAATAAHGVDGRYDDYVKGIITMPTGTRNLAHGYLSFVNAPMGESRLYSEEEQARVAERQLKAIEFALQHGATADMGIEGLIGPQGRGTIRELLPALVAPTRRRRR